MKNLIVIVIAIITLTTSVSLAQSNVQIARKKLYSGALGPVKIFIDGKYVCELKNNLFSTHSLPEGKHKLSAQWSGKKSKDTADDLSMEVDVKPGKNYYLKTITETKGVWTYPALEEVTENSWQKIKEDLDLADCKG